MFVPLVFIEVNMTKSITRALAIMSVTLAASANAVVLDLSVLPLGDFTTPVIVGEYVLTPNLHGSANPNISVVNGLTVLGGTDFSSGSDTFLTRVDGGQFTLDSVDIGLVPGYTTGQALGTNIVGQSLNGVATTTLQTISFGTTFAGITSIDLDETVGPYYTNINVTAAVPEPAMWAMMLVGFGITGAAVRRRSAAVAA